MSTRGLVCATMIGIALLCTPPWSMGEEGRPAGAHALQLLQHTQVPEGKPLPANDGALASDDASVYLNYATLQFYKGQKLLFAGDKTSGEAVFKEVEQALLRAIQLSEHDQDAQRQRLLRSQCAYLLGDLYAFVFKDVKIAKAFYQEAVRYVPEHDAASAALKRFP